MAGKLPEAATWMLALLPPALLILSLLIQPQVTVYEGPVEFSGERAYELLREFVTKFRGRVVGSGSCRRAAEWIASYFRGLGLNVIVDVFSAPGFNGSLVKAYNVYAIKEGSAKGYIVLLAHHDIVPSTEEGANDNGAGVAVLLELAKVLTAKPTKHGIVFLSTDAEETGLHGAKRFLETFRGEVIAAISIDMCCWRGHEGVTLYAFSSPFDGVSDLGLLLVLVRSSEVGRSAKVVGVDLAVLAARLSARFGSTDSEPFVKRGIPAVGISDYPVYPYWHEPEDTHDKVSPQSLEEVGALIERVVLTIDQGGLPLLGSHYLFVLGRAFYGPFLHGSWLSLVALTALIAVSAGRRASLRGALLAALSSTAVSVAYIAIAAALIARTRSFLTSALVVSLAAALTFVAVLRLVLAHVDANAIKLSASTLALCGYLLSSTDPSLTILLLAPHAYLTVAARPIARRALARIAGIIAPFLAFLTPIAMLAAAALMVGPYEVNRALALMFLSFWGRNPLLHVVVALLASSTALSSFLVARRLS